MKAVGTFFAVIFFITWNNVQPAVVRELANVCFNLTVIQFRLFSVIEPRMYIQKIAKRVVELLESRYLTGPDLPIDNYTSPIEYRTS